MKILAIDPGNVQSAFVLMESEQGKILNMGIEKNEDISRRIYAADHDVLVCEMIASYGMPVGKEVFETVLWIGRFIEAEPQIFLLVYRKDIKIHFCNSMRAKDSNIRQALLDRLGKEACKGVKKDIWSALAVGLYYQDMRGKL